jgi:hypothetical protein
VGSHTFVVKVLFLDWIVSSLLYYISQQVPGPTEIESPVPVEVSGVKPDLSGLLY